MVFGFGMDSICCSALVSAYSKLGLVDDASKVFHGVDGPDLAMWNSLLYGYGRSGLWDKGLELLSVMRNMGIKPDGYAVVALLSGLAEPCVLEIGQGIHGLCIKSGFDSNAHVGSSLVTMYSKCASVDSAQGVFCSLEQPDLVTWSALIAGMIHLGDSKSALLFFRSRNMGGMKADPVLLANILVACAQLANAGPGSEIHAYVLRHGLEVDVMVSSALIDMYSKCGFVDLAIRVFNVLPRRNIVTYNSAILGLGSHGSADKAFRVFDQVLERGFRPDESTFSALLHTCCQAGLVKEGEEIFYQMKNGFGIEPRNEHYVHMVKILGTAGRFDDAYNLVFSLPRPVDAGIWGALLACCEMHGNTTLAEKVLQHIFENQPRENSYSVQLSKIYADRGRWDDVEKLRDGIGDSGLKKVPGLSWLEGRIS